MSTRKKISELPQGIMSKKTIIGKLSGRKKTMNNKEFIQKLYDSVDARSVEDLSEFLAEDVRFVLGNHDPIVGKAAVLDANQAFFSSINAMSHHIDNVWSQGEDVICHGQVDYVRLNGSEYSAGFATFLKLQDNKIIDYLIYADISDL